MAADGVEDPMSVANAIGDCVLTDRIKKEQFQVNTLWKDQRVVLHVMRRFGCQICRLGAFELSQLKPALDELGVRLVGAGVETFGYKEFADGGYWDGELTVNEGKTIHKALNLKKKGLTSGFGLFASSVRREHSRSKARGFTGNLKGDGFQLGATFVLDQGGELLYAFYQKNYGDQAPLEDIIVAAGGSPDDVPANIGDVEPPTPVDPETSDVPLDDEEIQF